jgi:DNA-binding transcriptional LysR family regulator
LVLPQALADQPVTAQLLTDCGLIDHPDAAHYLTLYLDLCADPALAEVNPQRLPLSGYINQLPQILLPVAEGLGFTVLPQSAVENFSRRQDLFIAPCTTSVYETLYLVQKRHRQLPKRYEKVSHILVESLR